VRTVVSPVDTGNYGREWIALTVPVFGLRIISLATYC